MLRSELQIGDYVEAVQCFGLDSCTGRVYGFSLDLVFLDDLIPPMRAMN